MSTPILLAGELATWLFFHVLLGLLQIWVLYLVFWVRNRRLPIKESLANSVLLFYSASLLAATLYQLHVKRIFHEPTTLLLSLFLLVLVLVLASALYTLRLADNAVEATSRHLKLELLTTGLIIAFAFYHS